MAAQERQWRDHCSWSRHRVPRVRHLPLVLMLALAALLPGIAEGARPNGAGLVVRHGDGRIIYVYVEFTEPEISGAELLYRSGLSLTISPFGGLGDGVCMLDGEGCPADDCFCQSYQAPAYFWHYFRLNPDGSWSGNPVGPSGRKLRDGDVDGWSWTSGPSGLPSTSIDTIAQMNGIDRNPPEPTPTPTPEPTPTPTPPPTPTPTPAAAEATETPTSAPTPTMAPAVAPTPADEPTSMAEPTPSPPATPAAAGATPTTGPTATAAASPVARAVAVDPSGEVVRLETTAETESGGMPASYVAFGLILVVIAGASGVILMRRERGRKP